ncbi:unnamed protein product [Sympodiomycopsis kandeliae]
MDGRRNGTDTPTSSSLPRRTQFGSPTSELLPAPLVHLFSLHPFNAIPSSAIPLLTDIVHHYLSLITTSAASSAQHAQRSTLTFWDVMESLQSIGASDSNELQNFLKSEERNDWADRCQNGWVDDRAKEEHETRRKAWSNKMKFGTSTSTDERKQMRFVQLPDDDLPLYQKLQSIEEQQRYLKPLPPSSPSRHRSSSSSSSVKRRKLSSTTPGPSSPRRRSSSARSDAESERDSLEAFSDDDMDVDSIRTARTTPSPPLRILDPDEQRYPSREPPPSTKGDNDQSSTSAPQSDPQGIEYVPSFMPPFPGQRVGGTAEYEAPSSDTLRRTRPSPSEGVEELLASKRQTQRELAAQEAATTTSAQAMAEAQLNVKVEEQQAGMDLDEADASRNFEASKSAYVPSYFTPAVSFASSTVFGEETNADMNLPSLPAEDEQQSPPSPSSVPHFVSNYSELIQSGETPGFLPPSNHRKRMANIITAPSNYSPTDTLYGGIAARPSAIPFNPSASHLITLPPSGEGAPRFTPIRPRGRPLQLLPSGISNPILPCRQPSSTEHLSRFFTTSAPIPLQPIRSADGSIINAGSGGTDAASTTSTATTSNMLISSTPISASTSYTPNLSLLHRCVTMTDPEPLRDDNYVERVFRGVMLSGSENPLLRSESWFKSAVDAVRAVSVQPHREAGTRGLSGLMINGQLISSLPKPSSQQKKKKNKSSSKKHKKKSSVQKGKKPKGNKNSQYFDGDNSDDDHLFEDPQSSSSSSEEDESVDPQDGGSSSGDWNLRQEQLRNELIRKRSNLKVKNGTVVYTWDWSLKDYSQALTSSGDDGGKADVQ